MQDLYATVTNRIITALEAGTPPWHCPWTDRTALPANLATRKPYRGINVLMLAIEAQERGYSDSRWLTFKQANELGARVRKGERGTPIVFFKLREVSADQQSTESKESNRVVPMLRSYTVFNASQLEQIPERYIQRPVPIWQPITEADHLFWETGAVVRHGGNRAFYSVTEDAIHMPPPAWFPDADDYYAVALHELIHWTAHPARLDRPLGRRHGIEAYAYEELIAEMGAAFLCAHCGLPARMEHASYIDGWLDALRRDKRLIFVAAAAAQKAADYVLGVNVSAPTPSDEATPPEALAA